MLLRRKKIQEDEHAEINRRLEEQERQIDDMDRRVEILEIEAGIYVPPKLKEVNGK